MGEQINVRQNLGKLKLILFACLVHVTWCDYHVISLTIPVYYVNCIGEIYIFLVSHCYIWNKKKQYITSKFNFRLDNLDIDQVNTIFQISENVPTNGPLPTKYKIFEKIFFFI